MTRPTEQEYWSLASSDERECESVGCCCGGCGGTGCRPASECGNLFHRYNIVGLVRCKVMGCEWLIEGPRTTNGLCEGCAETRGGV